MAITTYRYVLVDGEGARIGELATATGRSLQRKHNGIDTASVSVALTDPLTPYLLRSMDEYRLQVWRHVEGMYPELVFYGPVVDAETVFGPASGVVQINAASPVWLLTHRYAFKQTVNGLPVGTKYIEAPRHSIAMQALSNIVNTSGDGFPVSFYADAMDTGKVGTAKNPYDAGWRNAAELLTEMSAGPLNNAGTGGDGFDFYFRPEPSAGASYGGVYLVARRGERRPYVVFETGIGTTNTATEARQAITRSGLANAVYHLPDIYDAAELQADPPSDPLPLISRNRRQCASWYEANKFCMVNLNMLCH
jgi:hypothetical protein